MNNLLIELKKSQLKDEFNELRERLNNQKDLNTKSSFNNHTHIKTTLRGGDSSQKLVSEAVPVHNASKNIQLQDTDNPEIKQGIKSNGVKYSVRTNRKRFFFPEEWKLFKSAFENDNQRRSFDILINTGARINECQHIKKQDIDFERSTLTIKVAKIKAKKGEKFPDPRKFRISSQFLERMREYTKDLEDDGYIYVLTDSALNIAMKKLLERVGIKDYKMFSVHNIRKTHGQWLVAHDIAMPKICKRLGHTAEVFLNAYCSPDTFIDKDREGICDILGDLIKPKPRISY